MDFVAKWSWIEINIKAISARTLYLLYFVCTYCSERSLRFRVSVQYDAPINLTDLYKTPLLLAVNLISLVHILLV